ncbi:hypothetical protein CONLIGDRAFT_1132 [Coniochaeta ligniaria NRRL 30616]|uniref:Uncharacterized protein n=1 Tax=Coniochaeta ligniaria NRRL 30616 TaxID=1408157 RepID=A0A1J7J4E8_9PEZI|nr:hypothetical protein CONLIGDRAFT_1132 [Coniochaeta ligniaria NRRL 30616]
MRSGTNRRRAALPYGVQSALSALTAGRLKSIACVVLHRYCMPRYAKAYKLLQALWSSAPNAENPETSSRAGWASSLVSWNKVDQMDKKPTWPVASHVVSLVHRQFFESTSTCTGNDACDTQLNLDQGPGQIAIDALSSHFPWGLSLWRPISANPPTIASFAAPNTTSC